MNRRVCSSYGYTPRSQLPVQGTSTVPKGTKWKSGATGTTGTTGAISPPIAQSSSTQKNNFEQYKRQKRVHFEPSSARKALSHLKSFTNRSIRAIKNNYSSRHKPRLPDYCNPQWISDAADPRRFTNPRSLRPPLRSCIQHREEPPETSKSVRSLVLANELSYARESDKESLIDFNVDTAAINRMWLPLSPTPYRPACIKDIEGLFV